MEGHFLVCGCDRHTVDVSSTVGESRLMNPFSGHWSNIDED